MPSFPSSPPNIGNLSVGAIGRASMVVGPSDLASAFTLATPEEEAAAAAAAAEGKPNAYPAVFATARMIALMELAAARVLAAHLSPGEISVGVGVDVQHLAATLPGMTADAEAHYLGRDGKLFRFRIEARDVGGLIGTGIHTRAVVAAKRLEEGIKRKAELAKRRKGEGKEEGEGAKL